MEKSSEKILVIGDPHFKKDNLHLMRPICDEILQLIDQLKQNQGLRKCG